MAVGIADGHVPLRGCGRCRVLKTDPGSDKELFNGVRHRANFIRACAQEAIAGWKGTLAAVSAEFRTAFFDSDLFSRLFNGLLAKVASTTLP